MICLRRSLLDWVGRVGRFLFESVEIMRTHGKIELTDVHYFLDCG